MTNRLLVRPGGLAKIIKTLCDSWAPDGERLALKPVSDAELAKQGYVYATLSKSQMKKLAQEVQLEDIEARYDVRIVA